MLRRFVGVTVTLAYANYALAGAWVEPKGEGLFIGSATYYSADSFYDANGQKQSQPTYRKHELQPYVEYGALDWLTVGGTVYLQHVSQSGTDNYGIADPEFFARARVWHDAKQVVSLQPLVKIGSRFAENAPPRGGSKSQDFQLAALYGRNLNIISNTDYLDTSLAYRIRDNGLGNQWRADAALGLAITPKIQLVPALRGVFTTNIKDAAIFTNDGDLDYDTLKAEVAGLYHLNDRQWVQASVFKDVIGVQAGNGYGLSLGFAQRF